MAKNKMREEKNQTLDLSKSQYDFTKIPFDKLTRVGIRSMLYRDMFTVSWLLGRFCNYHCSYCWAHGRSDTKDHRSTELCLTTINKIKEQARERGFNSFHFSLFNKLFFFLSNNLNTFICKENKLLSQFS